MAVSHWAEVLESNVNVANNTSTVTLRVHIITSGESHNYNEQLGNTYIYTPGENKFWRRYTLPYDTDTIVDSVIDGLVHNNDGSKTITWSYSLPTGISAGTLTGSGSATLTKIPRQTSITSFTVSKINETSLKFNWQTADTIDYAWYSTNNGSSWTGVDVTDGTSGNFNVSNLSPGTSYNCKIKVRRKDSQIETISSTVTQSTYAAPTISLYAKTETTVTVKWGLDTAASHLWYSINNGSSWVDVGAVSTKVGDITISGLTANTSYNIKVKLRRASSNTDYSSATLAVTTYDYPKVSGVGTSNLLIGDTQALTLYNPLNHSVTVKMYQNSTSGTELYSGTASGTSISFTPVLSTLYASIPNSTSGNCVYSVIYGNSTKTTTQYTYSIRGTETPIFSNFTYADTNYASKTGNNQVLVQGLSNLRVTISNENKMIARHSASGNKYTAACENRSGQVDYSSTENVTIDLGTIDTSGTKAISVSAYDSRNLYTTVVQEALVVPYSKPTIVSSATRLNNFENQTTLKVNGVFSKVTVDEVDKNTITNVKYRVREVGGEWGSLTAITFTTNDNKYTCSDVTLDLDNTKSFEIEVQTTDTMEQVTTSSVIVNIGIPSFFIKKTGGFESYGTSKVNGLLQVENEEVSDTLKAKFITPTFYTLDLSSLSTSNFYPITFPKDEIDIPLDCEIHSPSLSGSAEYNQNVIHFRSIASGWSDTPILCNVYEYGVYATNEITIGCIATSNNGIGTLKEGECIWLRGGMEYRFVSNFKPVLHSSDYSPASGVTYSVGTAYSGGTNSNITVRFTPNTTNLRGKGAMVGGNLHTQGKTTSSKGFTVNHFTGGAGTSGYMAICDLKITGSWENQWIIFHTLQRGRYGNIYLIFTSVSSTDPSLSAFRKTGSVNAYIAKTTTSTWRLFIQKTEAYDDIEITNLEKGVYSDAIQLDWVNTTVTSLPSGYTTASVLTMDLIATGAKYLRKDTTFTKNADALLQYTDGNGMNTSASNDGWAAPTSDWYQILHMPLSVANYYNEMLFGVNNNTIYTRQRRNSTYSGWQRIMQMKNLYDNSSGTTGTITLSESAANFTFLDIYYGDSKAVNGGWKCERVVSPNGKKANLHLECGDGTSQIRINMRIVNISGTSVTTTGYPFAIYHNSANSVSFYQVNEMNIYRIDGYR